MSHAVHTVNALVLGSAGVQEADKLFWLLTEDFGLLFASAKSVREEASKLRYSLQDCALTRASLVRGRGLWRIVGAEEVAATQLPFAQMQVFGRIAALVRRVTPTDEEQPEIFTIVFNAYDALRTYPDKDALVESVAVARILHRLGYLSSTEQLRNIIESVSFEVSLFIDAESVSSELIQHINSGLAESQL